MGYIRYRCCVCWAGSVGYKTHVVMHFRPFHHYAELNSNGEGSVCQQRIYMDGDEGQKLLVKAGIMLLGSQLPLVL